MSLHEFLHERLVSSSVVLGLIVDAPEEQALEIDVQEILWVNPKASGVKLGRCRFVQSPGHFSDPLLHVGNQAIVFLTAIQDRLYEYPWKGHMLVRLSENGLCVTVPVKGLERDESMPAALRSRAWPSNTEVTGTDFDLLEFKAFLISICRRENSHNAV